MKNRRVALRPAWFGLLACALIMLACSRDGCQATYASANLPDVAKGDRPLPSRDSTVEQRTYQGRPAGSAVVLEVPPGGGHTWPGGWQYLPPALIGWTNRDIDASQVIWQFFAAHPRA